MTGRLLEPLIPGVTFLLADGTVLLAQGEVTGGSATIHCEIYHPDTGLWSGTGDLVDPVQYSSGEVLPDGNIILVGGLVGDTPVTNCEIYDVKAGSWRETTVLLNPSDGLVVKLADGRIMVCGGAILPDKQSAVCQIFDPAKEQWTKTGDMCVPRTPNYLFLLPNKQILAVGGFGDGNDTMLTSCELYDPITGKWRLTGSLRAAHAYGDFTQLKDGSVLVSAGDKDGKAITQSELYDLATGQWKTP
jgi:N-acetylneuraminic acid mutarotase